MHHFNGGSSRTSVTPNSYSGRNRVIYYFSFFLAVLGICFILNFFLYQLLNFTENYGIQDCSSSFNKPRLILLQVQSDNSSNYTNDLDIQPEKKFWEKPTLFSLNFTWVRNNKTICASRSNNSQDLRIMPILVLTARSHFKERVTIRRTWGSLPIYKNWSIRFVFLLGESNPINIKEEERLNVEEFQYGDLVQGNFVDTWENLTYKHLMGYKWILNFCRDAEFVLKVDDDIFIDIMGFLDLRSEELNKLEKNKSSVLPDLYCNTFHEGKPVRNFVPFAQWPYKYYPDYCSGWAYFITVDLIQKIYLVSDMINFFWVDDVFFTGSLLQVVKVVSKYKPKIRYIGANITYSERNKLRVLCDSFDWNKPRLFKLVANILRGESFERNMMCMWNKTVQDSNYTIF